MQVYHASRLLPYETDYIRRHFLVAGIGQRVDAQVVANRVTNAVRDSGINLGRWATTVSVGTSAGDPANTTFDSLLAEAKADLHGEGADSRSLGKKPPA